MLQAEWPHAAKNGSLAPLALLWLCVGAMGTLCQAHGLGLISGLGGGILADAPRPSLAGYTPVAGADGANANASQKSGGGGGDGGGRGGEEPLLDQAAGVYNLVNPLELGPRYAHACRVLFPNAEVLAKYFGFQHDNVKGQVEHVVMLLANLQRASSTASSPLEALHAKIFVNYRKWCDHVDVRPQFANEPEWARGGDGASGAQPVGGKAIDVLLWFFIWGEAANLRHMPESLALLYHKCLQSWRARGGSNLEDGGRPPGHFLAHTVFPMYKVLAGQTKCKGDHTTKRNYDDFNEFFWSPVCLECCYTDDPRSAVAKSTDGSELPRVFVADALAAAPKAYLEKRSWFHLFLNFRRIYEFLVLTFQCLAVAAFGELLVWDAAFFAQALSSAFLTVSLLHVVWGALLAWIKVPPEARPQQNDSSAALGLLLGLLARYTALLFQTLYFTWAMDHMKLLDGAPVRRHAEAVLRAKGESLGVGPGEMDPATYWWWQYLWLSLAATALYGASAVLQLVPRAASAALTGGGRQTCLSKSDWWAAMQYINFPLSRLYVGKEVVENWSLAKWYQLFWASLLAFKFAFGYLFLVRPLAQPSLDLYDDFVNYPPSVGGKGLGVFLLSLAVRWFPAFFVYCIDLSIWYALWSGVVGMYVGMDERLGDVKSIADVRGHFMKAPAAFCRKLISREALAMVTQRTDCDLRGESGRLRSRSESARALPRFASGVNLSDLASKVAEEAAEPATERATDRATERAPLAKGECTSLLAGSVRGSKEYLHSYMSEFLSSHRLNTRQWVVFAAAWNEVVDSMRSSDQLSNTEQSMLLFESFPGFEKAIYLPVFQTAGLVEQAAALAQNTFAAAPDEHQRLSRGAYSEAGGREQAAAGLLVLRELGADRCVCDALAEAWELTAWLLGELLGPAHANDVDTVVGRLKAWTAQATAPDDASLQQPAQPPPPPPLGLTGRPSASAAAAAARSPVCPALFNVLNLSNLDRLRSSLTGLVKAVKAVLPKRKAVTAKREASPPLVLPLVPPQGLSVGSDGTMALSGAPSPLPPSALSHSSVDMGHEEVLEQLKQLVDALAGLVKPAALVAPAHRKDVDDVRQAITAVSSSREGFFWDSGYGGRQLDALAANPIVAKIVTKLHGLLAVRPTEAEPQSAEAKRRLAFWVNSLFMDMPDAPPIPDMHSVSVMTPFYSEDVIYTKANLLEENRDGVTVLLYLQTLYQADWANFLERIGVTDLRLIWSPKYLMETRLWASLRAQTLARTVAGMMHYESALRLMAQLERLEHDEVEEVLRLKFSYVVAAQVYGQMKKKQDTKAADLEWLLHKYPNLRVAYIDEQPRGTSGAAPAFYSCLVKSVPAAESGSGSAEIATVYRVKLPGNPVIGEGKPENQNHAVIFTRGEFMQAIDMNQDGYFEEALKHRNLLQEFAPSRNDKALPLTILGFREHIFTGSVSSLANYMALQEASFVTTGQRVLNRPLAVRLHYGHPDVFDKLFFLQNGGISKASKGINLSEDVFAGYSNAVRGGSVGFKEYCQVGKGRDVGLQQIYKFEAKLAQGNAEQCLSRDVARLANRLDFPRVLSYYFGGIGHYINSTLTVITIIVVTYAIAFMALFGLEKVGDRAVVVLGSVQVLLAGMGIVQTLPLIATLTVERGMGGAVAEIARVFGSGGPFYFIFHIQTRAFYFFQTLLAGGAQYRATGRNFVTRHTLFDENWRFFATSHIYLGIELLAALAVFSLYTESGQFWGHAWSMFVAAMAFVWTPYYFNPLAFNWQAVQADYASWLLWINSVGGTAAHSWPSWWREETGYVARLRAAEKITVLCRACLYLVMAYGVAGPNLTRRRLLRFGHMLLVSGGAFAVLVYGNWLGGFTVKPRTRDHDGAGASGGGFSAFGCVLAPRPSAVTRFLKVPAMALLLASLAYFTTQDGFLLHMAAGLYYALAAVYTVGVVCGYKGVAELLRLHDLVCGHAMFLPLFLLAALQLPDRIQTWLLYHNALSEGVLIDTILKQARRQQDEATVAASALPKEGVTGEIMAEMRRTLAAQQAVIGSLQRDLELQKLQRQQHHHHHQQPADEEYSEYFSEHGSPPAREVPYQAVPQAVPKAVPKAVPPSAPQAQPHVSTALVPQVSPEFVFRGAGPVG